MNRRIVAAALAFLIGVSVDAEAAPAKKATKKTAAKKAAPKAAAKKSGVKVQPDAGGFDFAEPEAKPAAAPVPVAAPAPAVPPPASVAAPAPPASTPESSATVSKKRRPKAGKGQQMVFDFSDDQSQKEIAAEVASVEKRRFDKAMDYMTDERWEDASFEWQALLEDQASAQFFPEAEYQLAKATHKLGLYNAALTRFKNIIQKSETHPRYQKAVEWLFFISRKLVDETPVLEELAQFTNVQWPKKYRNEYRYLLAKYQYLRAYDLEVQRIQKEEAGKYKAAAPIPSEASGMDFSDGAVPDAGAAMDFSADETAGKGGGNSNIGSMEFSFEDVETGTKKTEKLVDVIADVRRLVAQIPPDSKYYPRGKYLEGLADFLENKDQLAVDAFRQVIQILNPRKGKLSDPTLRENSFLALARAHYGYQQYNRAAFYYSKIERGSEAWLDALFESSWAYFRMSEVVTEEQASEFHAKALGNLVTLNSPFFVNEYYPEAVIIEAITYFDNCRYDQVKSLLKTFERRYRPLMEAMKKLGEENLSSDKYYQRLSELQQKTDQESRTLVRVLNVALSDQEVRRADASVREVQREIASVGKLPKELQNSAYGRVTGEDLQKVLVQRLIRAGDLAKGKIDREFLHLRDLLGQAYRIQFETVSEEKTTLENTLTGEGGARALQDLAYSVATDDEKLFWSFDGEFWADELGTYQYSLGRGCKKR